MRDDQRASGPYDTDHPHIAAPTVAATLRILATTDVHMQLVGHDYIHDTPLAHHGLAGLSTLITQARAEAQAHQMASVLFDNGDLIQGTAFGHTLSRAQVDAAHPIVATLNHMQYDAVGVGNHDLDYGLDYLNGIARHLHAPMIATNLQFDGATSLVFSHIATCDMPNQIGSEPVSLNIGLISILPERTAFWNAFDLQGKAKVLPSRPAIVQTIDALRQQGADIIVLLAHLGLEGRKGDGVPSDDVRDCAMIPGIDALITGHTHLRLPGVDHAGFALVNEVKGELNFCPAVMAGHGASDLAVLDLKLEQTMQNGWQVTGHKTELRANTAKVPADPAVVKYCEKLHNQSRKSALQPCGYTPRTIHNFFSLAVPTRTGALIARVKHQLAVDGVAQLPERDLPMLATAAAHTAGGRGGPGHFIHIGEGPILRGHLTALSPYQDTVCAVKITGQQVRGWLEHAAGVYNQLAPQAPDQLLIQASRPAFDFDTIYGLTYTIDPSAPSGCRVSDICHAGAPVTDDMHFVLATSSFRATGGGGGPRFDPKQIIFHGRVPLLDMLCDETTLQDAIRLRFASPWRFKSGMGCSAIMKTAPEARAHLGDIGHLSPDVVAEDAEGFLRIRLKL